MKKLLVLISPICVVLFVVMWISCGFEGALMFFAAMFFAIVATKLLIKWIEFVDKHIKD